MTRIGFTGTQYGMTESQLITLKQILDYEKLFSQITLSAEFHHGDCIGSDKQAHDIAVPLGFKTVIHPPLNPSKRAFCNGNEIRPVKPYLERNHDIVNETFLIIATPKESQEILRSGTWATVRYAKKCSKPTIIINPDGTFTNENTK